MYNYIGCCYGGVEPPVVQREEDCVICTITLAVAVVESNHLYKGRKVVLYLQLHWLLL